MKLYKYYKPTCSPCKTLKKIMDSIPEFAEFELIEVDMSKDENIEANPDIEVVPILRFENGKELIGVKSRNNLLAWLQEPYENSK